jgi:uracil-DNA glycosylase family 4
MNLDNFFEKYRPQCKAANGGHPVLIPKPDNKNGFEGAKIFFVNERPGRTGPGKSDRISFENEDPTALWFRELITRTGIDRKDIFITNACLYYPADANYKDRSPSTAELKSCAPMLKDQISRIQPRLIVTLGNVALRTLRYVFPESRQLKKFRLKRSIGSRITDTTPPIYPVYHTSSRARGTRCKEQQAEDWNKIPQFLNSQK